MGSKVFSIPTEEYSYKSTPYFAFLKIFRFCEIDFPRTKNNITKITQYGTANKTVELMFAKMPPKITDTLFMPYSSIA